MSRRNSIAITPNDGADLDKRITALYVGGSGTVVLECSKDVAPVTLTIPAGTLLEGLQIRKIHATGTSATLLIGFY